MITPWSWTTSNGQATDYQTQRAYTAITSNGLTTSFPMAVWNDLVDKIKEVTEALRHGWQARYSNYSATKMSANYRELTAERMNSAVLNVCYLWWSWALDSEAKGYLGRTEFRGMAQYGDHGADFVYGCYFLELTERLNLMIDIINDTGSLHRMQANGEQIGEFLAEAEFIETLELVAEGASEIINNSDLGTDYAVTAETLDRLASSIRAEMETSGLDSGLSGFAFQALRVVEAFRLLLPDPLEVNENTPLGGDAKAKTSEAISAETNEIVHIEGEQSAMVDRVDSMEANGEEYGRHSADPTTLEPQLFSHTERHVLEGDQEITGNPSAFLGWTTLESFLTSENEIIVINAWMAYIEKNLQMLLSLLVTMTRHHSHHFTATENTQGETVAAMRSGDVLSFEGDMRQSGGESADLSLDEPSSIDAEGIQSGEATGRLNRLHSKKFEGTASFILTLIGAMDMEYAKIAYMEALTEFIKTADAAVHVAKSVIAEKHESMTLDIIAGVTGATSRVMDFVWVMLLALGATLVTGNAAEAENRNDIELSVHSAAEAPHMANAMTELISLLMVDSSAKLERPSQASAGAEDTLGENATLENTEPTTFGGADNISLFAQSILSLHDNILPAFANVYHVLETEGKAGVVDVSHAMTASVLSELGIDAEIDRQIYCPAIASILANLVPFAILDYDTSWDYPIQTGTDLMIRQVKHTDQFGGSLYLDVGETITELAATLSMLADISMIYRKDGSCRMITFSVQEEGTMSVMSASDWLYPVKKGVVELSIRQVFGAKLNDYKLEVE